MGGAALPQARNDAVNLTILHNPRCSKSRKTLEIIRENGREPDIVNYLEEPPSGGRILEISRQLGLPVRAMLRSREAADAGGPPETDDERVLANWLSANINALERPIVISDTGRAVLGRPPENVLELIRDA
jgi:arsenate reductase